MSTPTHGGAHPPTDDLIARLSDGLEPVRRAPSPASAFALWLVLAAAVLIGALSVFGFRPEIAARLAAGLGPEVAALLAVGITSALLALLAAVPGREPRPVATAAAVGGLVLLAGVYALGPPLPSAQDVAAGWRCGARTVAIALAPWLVLLVAVRRGATLVPGRAGILAAVAAFFVTAAVLRMVCPQDARAHLLLFHLGPVVLGLIVSWLLGRRWLGSWRDGTDRRATS